jgi:AcrR family transcriptional regulator
MTEKQSRAQARNDKLRKVAAELFLKKGYDGVTIDNIVDLAGGSKSTVYSEFGGKCGLFIKTIEDLCRQTSESLARLDYSGLNLEQSLKKLSYNILKIITSKRAVELHRLAIGEAVNCPEVGEAWYRYGPARTTSFIQAVLERHRQEISNPPVPLPQVAVILHDALTGDPLSRLLSGVSKPQSDLGLRRTADAVVDLVLSSVYLGPAAARRAGGCK